MCLFRYRRSISVALAGLLVLCIASVGHAEKWTYVGVITDISQGPHSEISLGNTVTAQVEFDPMTPDTDPGSSQIGRYAGLGTSLLVEGNTAWHVSTGSSAVTIQIDNDTAVPGTTDLRDSITVDTNILTMPTLGDMTITPAVLTLSTVEATAPSVLSNDALPVTPPLLDAFTTERSLVALGYFNLPTPNSIVFSTTFVAFGLAGTDPLTPVLPTGQTFNADGSVTWQFANGASICVSGCWIDPPSSNSFTYAVTGAGLFTSIEDFPTGYLQDFEVLVGAVSLGRFGPADSVDFTGFPGGGVTSFVVAGISPGVDAENPLGFPLKIALDSASTQFSMTSAPPAPAPFSSPIGRLIFVGLLLGIGFWGLSSSEFRAKA